MQLQVPLQRVLTLLLLHKSMPQRVVLQVLVHSEKLLVSQLSHTASVLLPLVIRVQRPTLERVVLTVKRSDHQTPASQLLVSQTPDSQMLGNQQLVSRMLDNQTLDSQQPDNRMLDNQTLVNQLNKVQLSVKTKLSAATQTMTEFLMHST
jgi:hypothetical protein